MQKEIEWLLKEKYSGKPNAQFSKDIARLKRGEPLDYVIGFTEFLGCKIDLSQKPLIPRPETEYWVGQVMKKLSPKNQVHILDMFAGSGCIGISIMRHMKHVTCDFADVHRPFLAQVKINCKLNKVPAKKYRVIHSDIFSNIQHKYDYIFANPPYIPTTKKHNIQASVLTYEPRKALFGGTDGLWYIKRFLAVAKKHLNTRGNICIEFDSPQKRAIETMLKKYGYTTWEFHRDQYGKWRWVVIG
jgi:release factor glutamine methyltransferase